MIYKIVRAEIKKHHSHIYNSPSAYISLLIWPLLMLIEAYYSFKPFDISLINKIGFYTSKDIYIFLLTGFLGYNCFWSLVQSAWEMSIERQNGTLEMIMITPANKVIVLYGRAAGAIYENIWIFIVFSILLITNSNQPLNIYLLKLIVSFLLMLFSAIIWGGFMNVLFLFSRDSSILFNIFDIPMSFFSGVRVPVNIFPHWAKAISAIYPLTYVLVITRSILINNSFSIKISILSWLSSIVILILLTTIFCKLAENKGRVSGEYNFY